MLAAADPSQVPGLSRFFKTGPGQYGEGDKFLGIKVPVTREIVRRCWKTTVPHNWQDAGFPELEKCITSGYHEVRLAALLSLVEIFRHASKASHRAVTKDGTSCQAGPASSQSGQGSVQSGQTSFRSGQISVQSGQTPFRSGQISVQSGQGYCRPGQASSQSGQGEESLRSRCVGFYLEHTAYINNWDLVNLSCYPLLGEWLLDKDRSLLYELARNGRTIWEQRIGIVSTMTFIRHGQLQDTFAIADILLHHPHDLIHKAVGWLLREAGKRDQAALEAWLQEAPGGALQKVRGGERKRVTRGALNGAPEDVVGKVPGGERKETLGETQKKVPAGAPEPRYRQMPRTMLRYAIEKFPDARRLRYLKGLSGDCMAEPVSKG